MSAPTVVESFLRALEDGDEKTLRSLMDEEFRYGHEGVPGLLDRAGFLRLVRTLRTAMPDLRFNAGPVQDDDVVWTDIRIEGTQTRRLDLSGFGWPAVHATNQRVSLPMERAVFIVGGDRILYHGVVATAGGGWPGLYRQLGVTLPTVVVEN